MAILNLLPGLEVSVCVDGQHLQECDTENDEIKQANPVIVEHLKARTITKYIESETDKIFTIKASFGPDFKKDCPKISIDFDVDGVFMDSRFLSPPDPGYETVCKGKRCGSGQKATVRAMKFAKIEASKQARHQKITRTAVLTTA